ncbi:hypothetical protein CCM_07952 [Cordyceps militaris CM01]|uniref:Uncharacterized protein n=1 Tax=Cordyceps militaris (strain CM01) TaxID=983644 RepID=G3JP90_CORMM|nr:uncharacterized protein CCM_07952 [Cordyceps militaris CM01]EGX89700.1 hypothetical protein CCM_07952 [Cordyceps militaris CM01]
MKTSCRLPSLLLWPLGQLVRAQLVWRPGPPTTASNFRVRLHSTEANSPLGAVFENLVLATSSDCDAIASIGRVDDSSLTLFVNVESEAIQSERHGKKRFGILLHTTR